MRVGSEVPLGARALGPAPRLTAMRVDREVPGSSTFLWPWLCGPVMRLSCESWSPDCAATCLRVRLSSALHTACSFGLLCSLGLLDPLPAIDIPTELVRDPHWELATVGLLSLAPPCRSAPLQPRCTSTEQWLCGCGKTAGAGTRCDMGLQLDAGRVLPDLSEEMWMPTNARLPSTA